MISEPISFSKQNKIPSFKQSASSQKRNNNEHKNNQKNVLQAKQ